MLGFEPKVTAELSAGALSRERSPRHIVPWCWGDFRCINAGSLLWWEHQHQGGRPLLPAKAASCSSSFWVFLETSNYPGCLRRALQQEKKMMRCIRIVKKAA